MYITLSYLPLAPNTMFTTAHRDDSTFFSHCNSQLPALVSQKPSIMSPKLYNKIVCTFLVIASKPYYIQAS